MRHCEPPSPKHARLMLPFVRRRGITLPLQSRSFFAHVCVWNTVASKRILLQCMSPVVARSVTAGVGGRIPITEVLRTRHVLARATEVLLVAKLQKRRILAAHRGIVRDGCLNLATYHSIRDACTPERRLGCSVGVYFSTAEWQYHAHRSGEAHSKSRG